MTAPLCVRCGSDVGICGEQLCRTAADGEWSVIATRHPDSPAAHLRKDFPSLEAAWAHAALAEATGFSVTVLPATEADAALAALTLTPGILS